MIKIPMPTYFSFDPQAIIKAIEMAKEAYERKQQELVSVDLYPSVDGQILVSAACIAVSIEEQKVYVDLPLDLGKKHVSVPSRFPNGMQALACLDICSREGVSCGVKVSIIIGGVKVANAAFGDC